MKRPNLTPAVLPKYLSDETKIYIFINRIPREDYRIILGFFKILCFPPLVDIYRHPLLTSFQTSLVKALFLLNFFSDINECATGTHNCSAYAVCNNTKGRHNCICKKGFIGDGKNCTGKIFTFALVMVKVIPIKCIVHPFWHHFLCD